MMLKTTLGLASILLLLGLGGCDSAEKAADSFATKVEQAAREQARETLGGTLDELNKKVDEAQKQSRAWLDQQRPKERDEAAPPRASKSVEGVET
ncbi:hypothetical protein [Pseudomonas oryzihabitans]|uniref:Uncharacterized protein with von Willebrand factor type A (VWA) domain n=1 Tax=Pseudomonas oryzihabitans TaxID=47885 RepID=A0AAJ2BHF3_9PSED|nr:hypothetical protein [Pseudomonas psychrotolerans]MDR6232510.1 uncharacterized protein with von Willebrand factor type A (vWA) domain [Pseudomonas psychrotolerans]MDR6358563.1 uncharacterized protein with von Willebrand factor type A (vWA) domain [Pseudomonas psychrotolerans]